MQRFRYRIFNLLLFVFAILVILKVYPTEDKVLGASSENLQDEPIQFVPAVVTTTAFSQKEIQEFEPIPYQTRYEEDDELEYGIEKILVNGEDGVKTLTYLLTYWVDEEIDKKLINTKIEKPVEEVISKGTKIVWRMYSTPDVGRVKYWYKMRVYATKYDGNCPGCTGRTYSGTQVVKGVCATDPKVIPLGTNFYVDGYGLCRAEDIGGAIKGNIIDLGYEVASQGAWQTRYTDIYLLTNPPY